MKHLLKVNSPGVVIETIRRNSVKCQCLFVYIWNVMTFALSSLAALSCPNVVFKEQACVGSCPSIGKQD